MNRRAIAALLAAGLPLALGIGAGVATAQPPVAPPLAAITAPISAAPLLPGKLGWGFDGATTLVAISCARTTTRPAWSMPLTQQPLLSGGNAGFSKTIAIIDTVAVGSQVEWVAYGSDPTTPLLRSGCLDSAAQRALSWGDPVISERATVRPPPAGAALAILPGEPATTAPYAAGPATTAPATTAPATSSPTAQAATPAAPTYTGTPDTSAPSQAASDFGSGILGAGILGVGGWAVTLTLITLALVGLSRGHSRRMRTDQTDTVSPGAALRGFVAGGLAVITGLIATGVAAAGLPAYALAVVLALAVGWTVAHQVASREGHGVPLRGLLAAAREAPPYAVGGLVAGAAIGYVVAGSTLTSPAEGYSAAIGLVIGAGLTSLRQARAAHQRWLSDAHLVADLLAVPVKAVLEMDEVRFAAQADGGYRITLLNQAARQHLPDLPERVAQIAPHLDIERADRDGVILVPADAETVAARESVAASGGLVGGQHAGADPWAESPAESHTDVNMSKQPGTDPGVIDLSEGWD